jgi:hypothetical protein
MRVETELGGSPPGALVVARHRLAATADEDPTLPLWPHKGPLPYFGHSVLPIAAILAPMPSLDPHPLYIIQNSSV